MRVLRGNDILINWSVFYDAGGVKTNVDFSNSTLSVFILDSYGKRAVEHTVSGNVISIHYGGEIQRLGTVAIDAYWQNNNTLVWSRAKKNEVVELVDNPESVTLDGVPTDISITTINTSSDTFFGGTYNANFSNYYTKEEIDNKIISDYNFLSNKPLIYDEETGKYTAIDAPINFVNNINIGNFVAGASGINFAADGSGEIGTLNVRDRLIVNGVEITGSGTGGIDVTNMWNVLGSADDSDKQINIVHLTDALSGYLQTSTFDDLFEKVNIGTLAAPKYAIKAKYDFYSIGEVSAFGAGSSGGSSGSGLIQTVYGISGLSATYSDANLTETFNAAAIKKIYDDVVTLQNGSLVNYSLVGTGNAITNVSKTGNSLTFTKGLNFSISGHTHSFGDIDGLPTTLSGYGITDGVTTTSFNEHVNNFNTHINSDVHLTITQKNILAHLQLVNGKLQADIDFYSTGEVSAFGAGSGGSSGGGLIQTVYGYSSLGSSFNNATLTDTFNAYTINQLHTRLSQVEVGAAVNVAVSGTGNAITGVTKNGNALEFTKGLTFSLASHTHNYVPLSQKGAANGVASLDANGLIISAQLPSYVDDVIEVSAYANLPVSGESGKIYVTTDTNITYRWTGTTYVEISKSLALGETSSTAYRGDLGAIAYAHSQIAGGTGVHISSTERTNWNLAYTNNHTHTNKSVLDGITSTLIANWNLAYTNNHTHANKSLLDAFSQSDNDVLNHLSIVDGKLKADIDFYSTGEVSAFGAGSGTGGSGLIQTVYGLSGLGGTYSDATLTDTFNAYTINSLHGRINSLEAGSALNFATTGSGNVVTSVTKSGTSVSVVKGLTAVLEGDSRLTNSRPNPYALTFSGYSTETYDGSAAVTVALPTKLSQLTNDSGYLTSIDADLVAIAALTGTSGLLRKTAANTWSLDTNAYLTAITKAQVEAVLTGNITTHTHSQYLTGNQTITVSGDVTGSGATSIALTLANSGVVAGTYNNSATQVRPFTVDSKGRVTSIGTAVTITPAWGSVTGKPTTIGGYGITDAYTKTQIDSFLALKLNASTFNDLFEKVNIGTVSAPIYAIKAKYNFYSVGEVSAFGAGAGSGGSGLIQTVYGYSGLSGTYNDTTLTDTFNAYTINKINSDLGARITSLEAGSALAFTTVGSGNAVTSVTKSGTSVTVTKGLTFSIDGHTHSYLPLSGGTLTGNLTAPTFIGALSGNASTATKLSAIRTNWFDTGVIDNVVGQLAWKNYGNNHTIFDASNGYTPNGTVCDRENSLFGWKATYPTLMGYNGSDTYGVRVDSSRMADKLRTSRTIWGQNFDGTGNISGALANATTGSFSSHIKIGGGTVNLGGLWDGGIIVGNDGHDKVVATYLTSVTNSATIGAHSSALDNWAKLNIAGTSIQFSIGETPKMNLDNGGNLVLSGHLGVSSAGKVASFGINSNAPSTAIANQNTFIQLVTSGATNSMGLIFHNSGVSTSALEYVNGDSNNGYFNFKSDNTSWELKVNGNKVWHSANDGSGSGLDADTLDGVHYSNMWGFSAPTNYDLNNLTSSYINSWSYDYSTSASVLNQPLGNNVSDARGVLSIYNGYRLQLSWRYIDPSSMYVRSFYNGNWYEWKQFAFVTSNVASATKLQTGRYIFGQYFDGTSDTNGDCVINRNGVDAGIKINNDSDIYSTIRFNDTSGNFATIHAFSDVGYLYNGEKSINIDAAGAVTFGAWNNPTLYIKRVSKNVGINTTNPQSALDIASGSLTLRSFANRAVNTGEGFEIGYSDGGILQSYDRTTFTYKLINYNASQHIFNVGNVLIGTTTDSGHKLNVAGNVFFGGTLGTTSTLTVRGTTAFDSMARLNITNGSADYGRAHLRITGRLQNGNDSWSMDGRNNIIFAVNANESNVGVGGDGVNKMSIQYNMVANQLGIVSESSINSPIASISQNGDAAFNGAVTANRFYAGYDSGIANSISCSNWFYSNGNTGWYNATYGGGIYMTDTTYVRVYNNKSFWVNNNIVATGEITAFGASDIRLKSNIKPIDSALDFLGKVKTYEFDWNEKAISLNPLKTKRGAGVIAQEMNLLDNNFVHSIYGDYLGVDYERFIPYLIGGVNETNKKVVTIGKRLNDVDSEIDKLKYKISELENKLMEYERN